jgi:hypothetical protein
MPDVCEQQSGELLVLLGKTERPERRRSFGDAPFDGSMGNQPLSKPITGVAASVLGGYWLVAADGGVFSFGNAPFDGSMGGKSLNAPMTGIAATTDGRGYWLVGADNGVFAFGDAPFLGPTFYG